MATVRQITCIRKRNHYFDPHEIIESIGGEYLGQPWLLPDYLAIYYIKNRLEKYFIMSGQKRLKVIIGIYNNKEYLKTEIDDYSPDSLLALSQCC
jgi:hypothetical protein